MATSCWLNDAHCIKSPNFDNRPVGTIVDTIIIHSISLPAGHYENQYVEDFFQNKLNHGDHSCFQDIIELKVSAHFYIKRDGQIVQFVDAGKRAWHAGKSDVFGRRRANDFSIGIELEGTDKDVFEEIQYNKLNETINQLRQSFPCIRKSNVLAHSDIAPGRKTDPGVGFDWSKVNFD